MKSLMVRISQDYVTNKGLPEDIGLVIRGPYESVIKLTEDYSSCEVMYDLLIAGRIYKIVPCYFHLAG